MATLWNKASDLITSSRKIVTPKSLQTYRERMERIDYIGSFQDSRLVAFASVEFHDDHYYISQLVVDPRNRHQGIGSKLLIFLMNLARRAEITTIQLAVQVTNISAINFFLSHGFIIKKCLVEKEYVPNGFDISSLDLTDPTDQSEFLRLVEYNMEFRTTT